jgi:signal transduction histidine kinase/CheY-like chemotaxis protein
MNGLSSSTLVNAGKELNLSNISMAGRVRLLEIAYSRFRFGLFAMPLVSLMFVWYYRQSSNDYRMLAWALCYGCATALAAVQYKIYLRDLQQLSADAMYTKWLPRIENTALVHGLGLAVVLPLVAQTASLEFKYLYLVTLAAIMAGNGIDQAPMPSVYHRFLLTGWNLMVLSMPWSFPNHWPFLMPLSAIFGVMKYWNSTGSNNFFVQLVWHEEEGARLIKVYKNANEEAAEALSEKNLFLATASHDLRQPIHAMSMWVEAIRLRNQDEAVTPMLVDLKSSMNSLNQMFTSLLDLSKLEAGILQPSAEPVALPSLIRESAQLFREQAASQGLELRVRVPERDAVVLADAVLLRQALANLTHNALRYTQSGGVLLGVRRRGGDWLLEVWDTGIGIAAEDQHQVFSAYYRSELAWRVDSAGHGLGLAVVARCAKLMGATYGVSSRMGRGSRFWLQLPAHRALAQEQAVAVAAQTTQALGFQRLTGTCLVLDDDVHVIAAWTAMLEGWGVQARYASSATQALAHIEAGFSPKAIFCDQRLRSGESGFDILRALLLRCPHASGAMVSGEFNSSELQQAENEGYMVLRKPLDVEQLYTVLETWLTLPKHY